MNVFDRAPLNPPDYCCYGCTKALVTCRQDNAMKRAFKQMTGRAWPGSVSLNLHADFTRLDLPIEGITERGTFCLGCAMNYMLEFNLRNQKKLSREAHLAQPKAESSTGM